MYINFGRNNVKTDLRLTFLRLLGSKKWTQVRKIKNKNVKRYMAQHTVERAVHMRSAVAVQGQGCMCTPALADQRHHGRRCPPCRNNRPDLFNFSGANLLRNCFYRCRLEYCVGSNGRQNGNVATENEELKKKWNECRSKFLKTKKCFRRDNKPWHLTE